MSTQLIDLLRCPRCRLPLQRQDGALACENKHIFRCDGPYIVFAHDSEQSKYNQAYANRYAFLWAYGYETSHSGLVESLYRSVGALVADALAEMRKGDPIIIDCGCGTGRSIADAAMLAPSGQFLGVDLSSAKLELAAKILRGTKPVEAILPDYGFGDPLSISGRGLSNVILVQADALQLPFQDSRADLLLSVNLLDRVEDPTLALREARRVLRSGGALILTTPLNWTKASQWNMYPDAKALISVVENCGFSVKTWFDQLLYREILDARGSVEEFATLVISGRAS